VKVNKTKFDPVAALRKLRKIEADYRGAQRRPEALKLAEMFVSADLMQQREGERAHVKELRAGIKAHGALDPILVRQVGAKFLVIDGHHRFAAYDAELVYEPVPVVHLEGDLRDAIKVAIRSNAKAKLNMTEEDKLNAAWRMTCMTQESYSIAETAKTCDIGTTTVTNMRAVRDRLNADDGWALGPDDKLDVASKIKTWAEARRKDKGRGPLSDEEKMDIAARRVKDFVKRFQKEFGPALRRNANTTAEALSDHLGERFKDVAEAMWGILADSEREAIAENVYGLGDDDGEPGTGEIIGEQPGEDVKPEQPRPTIMETLVPIEHPKGS
jgi:ParB-like nuclease domain